MTRSRKFTPEEFAAKYLPLKGEHAPGGVRAIAKRMGITKETLHSYLKDESYLSQITPKQAEAAKEGETKGRRLLDKGLDIGLGMADDLMKQGEKSKALALILKLCPLIKTEGELIRTVQAVQIAIDARQQTVNVVAVQAWQDSFVSIALDYVPDSKRDEFVARLKQAQIEEASR